MSTIDLFAAVQGMRTFRIKPVVKDGKCLIDIDKGDRIKLVMTINEFVGEQIIGVDPFVPDMVVVANPMAWMATISGYLEGPDENGACTLRLPKRPNQRQLH